MTDEHAALRRWFEEFEECVRGVDFAAGRAFFADDAVAFGTKADVVTGLDAIVANQWRAVWPNITDFTFRVDQLQTGQDGDLAWAVLPWTSTGYDPSGTPFERPGRATLVFVRRDGRWLAKHSHFSLTPGTPPTTYGRQRREGRGG